MFIPVRRVQCIHIFRISSTKTQTIWQLFSGLEIVLWFSQASTSPPRAVVCAQRPSWRTPSRAHAWLMRPIWWSTSVSGMATGSEHFFCFARHFLCQSGLGPVRAPTDLVWNQYYMSSLFQSSARILFQIHPYLPYLSSYSIIDWFQTTSSLKWLNRQVRPNLFGLGSAAEDLLHQRCCPWEFCGIVRGGVCPKGGPWLKQTWWCNNGYNEYNEYNEYWSTVLLLIK